MRSAVKIDLPFTTLNLRDRMQSFWLVPGITKGRIPPDSFKRWLTANAEDYEDLTYRPRGRSWFVLSGYRGDQIYYEKVMFSCGGRVVNILAVAYPVASRRIFDPVVERMEDRFRPSRQCA